MRKESVGTVQELGDILSRNTSFANGKNRPLDHLHATGACSRFVHENIYGIYFTNEDHAWMALWIAVTDRTKVRKRNITYVRPNENDAIGGVAVYSPDTSLDVFCDDGAFIY